MRLSIVIPAYNEAAYLEACLRCVVADARACGVDEGLEIIVVNNASTDATAEIAARFSGVRIVSEPRKGLTMARQRGLEAASGAIIAYVDADTRMPRGWIRKVLRTFESDPRIVCASGPCTYYDLPAAKMTLVWLYWLMAKPAYWITRYMAVGCNFAASRDALHQINGFDTAITFYGEDTNIARRLSKVGVVSFRLGLVMPASARRLNADGLLATAIRYLANFFSEVALKRPVTHEYRDIR